MTAMTDDLTLIGRHGNTLEAYDYEGHLALLSDNDEHRVLITLTRQQARELRDWLDGFEKALG
jgi:hypothetical protein